MKQVVPAFLITYPTASSRTIRTPCDASEPSQLVISARVAGAWTSRSTCSAQSAVPNVVHIRSGLPVPSIVTVENGPSGLAQEDSRDVLGAEARRPATSCRA